MENKETLQVMAMNRNGDWDWVDIDKDLEDRVYAECIEKRLPHRWIKPTPTAVNELDLEERARKYLMETIHDDNHAIFNAFIAGWNDHAQTKQSKVVELINVTIKRIKKGADPLVELTDLLTKLNK